jgi:hypothetical protein
MRIVLPLLVLLGSALAAAGEPATRTYGEKVPAASPVPLAQVLGDPDAWAGKDVVVDGKVKAVCQNRGCWMELATGSGPSCRVIMKDHAFFLPKDSAGASARVAGAVSVKAIPAAQVKHMESEGGSFAAKLADGSAREVRIVATAVELTR